MKRILLDSKKNFYKANLHCHSTISDGTKTPEELKEMYMKEGYSAIAYTDHDALVNHSDLSDGDFIALNGYEMEINGPAVVESDYSTSRVCHLCYVALEPDNLTQVCYHRSKYLFGNAPKYRDQLKFDDSKPDYERQYTPECINEMIAEGVNNGFFVTYNHPAWSLEGFSQYGKYKGMHAMEICNYGCLENGWADYNEKEYDELLRTGQKLYCIATDDNHNYRKDSFGGFAVINADKLEYKKLTDALLAGEFYASQGPAIHELWYEDGKIGIKCSDAAKIVLNTGRRRADVVYASEGKPATEAVFDVCDNDIYVRLTVTDASGKPANTNAYFVEDLKK